MRCLTLAREFTAYGESCYFFTRTQRGDLFSLIRRQVNLVPLSLIPDQSHFSSAESAYSDWLGCSQDQDALDTINAFKVANLTSIRLIVIDHYSLDKIWHDLFRNHLSLLGLNVPFLIIDDLANRPLYADFLLDQNRIQSTSSDNPYLGLVPSHCKFFFGPYYALIGESFRKLKPLLPPRKSPLQRLLIFFGASDIHNFTELALKALLNPHQLSFKIDVVIGNSNPHRQRIIDFVSNYPHIHIHDPLPCLSGLMAQADLAIGAGGVTSWERACLSLPSLVYCIASNQSYVVEQLSASGAAISIGDFNNFNPQLLRDILNKFLSDPNLLQQYSEAASSLTDGWGTPRIHAALFPERIKPLYIRPALSSDVFLWFRWANDLASRQASFSSDTISLDTHKSWFQTKLSDPFSFLFVAHSLDGLPIGYIRFESKERLDTNNIFYISIALDTVFRGHGLAFEVLESAISFFVSKYSDSPRLIAEIKSNNYASQRLFNKAGFVSTTPERPGSLCLYKIVQT